tara:strand:+ start:5465 stop:6178 length:714 start_codon:yes stop_codon:yes gene_type:complete
MIKFSIIVPCFNELESLPFLLEKFLKYLNRDDIEIILVDNGSYDGSKEKIPALIKNYFFAKSIRIEKNIGYGNGILEGIVSSTGEYVGWTHADLQTDPKDILEGIKIIEKFESNKNSKEIFVKGNRNNRHYIDNFFTKGMSFFVSIIFGKFLWDINAQPNILHRKMIERWPNPPLDFSFDLFIFVQAVKSKCFIKRFNVSFPKRIFGKSKWNFNLYSKFKFSLRTIRYALFLKKSIR